VQQLRQPRLADIVAASLRDDILSGRLKEGDSLPRQDLLFEEFRVSPPAVREAMRILETEGLVSVRRGNVGGAVVHLPTASRTARMISMVLQSRATTLSDVSGALLHMEPVCAGLCAGRDDRHEEVVPALREVVKAQADSVQDSAEFTTLARRFHEVLVDRCGNETLKVVIGSLESIWSAHHNSVWREASTREPGESDEGSSDLKAMRRSALRDHEKLVAAIEKGDVDRTVTLAGKHLAATRSSTLSSTTDAYVVANLLDEASRLTR
jgi:GntR family transcriptional repressor for pyruvate dehydrogenase complex